MEKGHGSRALSFCAHECASLRRVSRRALIRTVSAVVICASIVAGGARIAALSESVRALTAMNYGQRRAAVMGPYYASITLLRTQLPSRSTDLVVRGPREIDTAIFANYYLYPRLKGFYRNLDLWRAKRRRPDEMLLWMDAASSPAPRMVSYLVARSENGRGKSGYDGMKGLTPAGAPFTIIPLVCSIDGAPPDEYVVPLLLENPGSSDATVTLSYYDRDGWSDRRLFRVPAGARLFKEDLLVDAFGRMGIGWMAIESDRPVRVAASLVNRGRGTASSLIVAAPEAGGAVTSATLRSKGPAAKLFMINPRDGWATVDIDAVAGTGRLATRIQLAPYELRVIPDPGSSIAGTACRDCAWSVHYSADRAIFVYASREDLNGLTHFAWREGTR